MNHYSAHLKERSAQAHELLLLVERIKFRLNFVIKRLSKTSHRVFQVGWKCAKEGELWFYLSKRIVLGLFVAVLLVQLHQVICSN